MTTDMGGLWIDINQKRTLDDQAARDRNHVYKDKMPGPHGTFTRLKFICIHMGNNSFEVFDENGDFRHFVLTGKDNFGNDVYISNTDKLSSGGVVGNMSVDTDLDPKLILDQYDDQHPAPFYLKKGDLYNRGVDDAPSRPAQKIVHYAANSGGDETFAWYLGDEQTQSLEFLKVVPQVSQKAGSGVTPFRDVFLGQSPINDLVWVYLGFDPRQLNVYPEAGSYGFAPSSLPTYRDDQDLPGQLIFNYPKPDSKDYHRMSGFGGNVYLPLGVSINPAHTKDMATHTQLISSLADRMGSWAVTLGLSAGVEGMFSLSTQTSYSNKIEEQKENESRYSVCRKVTQAWNIFADLPNLTLSPGFLSEIYRRAQQMVAGQKPDWEGFVKRFGSHYLHALTQGEIEFAETRFSLEAESIAYTNNLDLKVEAGATMEGVEAKASVDYQTAWSQKNGMKVSNEDVVSFSHRYVG